MFGSGNLSLMLVENFTVILPGICGEPVKKRRTSLIGNPAPKANNKIQITRPYTCTETYTCKHSGHSGLEVIFLVHLQVSGSKIFSHWQTGETTSKLFPFVWETWRILTRNRLLVDIFLTRRLSKSLAFCEFTSVNFEP